MTLPQPPLDDRDWRQLVAEAQQQLAQSCPDWTDRSPGDPGVVLLELFAFLTEALISRLNRLPESAFRSFLNLLGVKIEPPAAARVTLRFSRASAAQAPLPIPRGTRVTTTRAGAGAEPPVFVTLRAEQIAPGALSVDVPAMHAEEIAGELAGTGTGQAGLALSVRRPPIIAPSGAGRDLIVGVEWPAEALSERVPAISYGDKRFRIWREVRSFAEPGPDRFVYLVDRASGSLTFAPSARRRDPNGVLEATPRPLAAFPALGREVRVWYRRGGGEEGNVVAGSLTVLKDPIPGVQVTNPAPASGGRRAESLDNALVRGPQELHSLERAVTARDFERAALVASRAVVRAHALTRAALWTYAAPGTVEVLLVPAVPDTAQPDGVLSAETLGAHQSAEVQSQVQASIDERRPLGTTCVVTWARYKTVRVSARIVVRGEESPQAVQRRVIARLRQTISPLPTALSPTGWPFGEALRASRVYDMALAEPGVRWVDRVRLLVDAVPSADVGALAADHFQPSTWYAAAGPALYRTLNDGQSWEPSHIFEHPLDVVRAHPRVPGTLALATRVAEGSGAQIFVSRDCGEAWEHLATTAFAVEGLAWTLRDGAPLLFLATAAGLFELALQPGSVPLQIQVDAQSPDLAFVTVVTATDPRGHMYVAAAAGIKGVYLSSEGGRPGSFRPIGLTGEDVRTLAAQYDGPRTFLWAGVAAAGAENLGKGCFSWELRGADNPPEGWQAADSGWNGGSCWALAFRGTNMLAASHRSGVLRFDTSRRETGWVSPDVSCGLPLRDRSRFHPVRALAADPGGHLLLAGGLQGVYRSADNLRFELASRTEFSEMVTLPRTWLFCCGDPEITVVSEDETE